MRWAILFLFLVSGVTLASPKTKEDWVLVDHELGSKIAQELTLEASFQQTKIYQEAALDRLRIAHEMMEQKKYPQAYWLYTDVLELGRIYGLDLSDFQVPKYQELARQAWWKSISDAEKARITVFSKT